MAGLTKVEVYTDGACSGNPGPGGYGVVIRYADRKGVVHEKELSEGFPETTNNRMEVKAAIEGLKQLNRPCAVDLYSDSKYLCDAFNRGWIEEWKAKDFRRGRSSEVKNIDLWEELLQVMEPHEVTFIWVKGHAGNPHNERCDRLAVKAYETLDENT